MACSSPVDEKRITRKTHWRIQSTATDALLLEKAQRSVARLVTGAKLSDRLPNEILLARVGLEELGLRRQVSLFVLVRRLTKDSPRASSHLISAFKSFCDSSSVSRSTTMSLRSDSVHSIRLSRPRSELFRRSPFYVASSLWNSLPENAKASTSALISHLSSS